MTRDALPVVSARGFSAALTTWKALLLALALNAALATVLVRPLVTALHETLDRNPWADRMATSADPLFLTHLMRNRPDVIGDIGKAEETLTGATPIDRSAEGTPTAFLPKDGIAGSALAFGALSAALAAFLSGGFAGRFGARSDRSSLSAFGSDCGKFALPSLFLGLVSAGLILSAWRWIYLDTGLLYAPDEFRYEWQAVALQLLRLLAFLVVAAYVRLVVLFTRAAMGIAGSANVVAALGSGLGIVLRRPVGVLLLEILFGAVGILPLVLWGFFGTTWDGKDPSDYALFLALQQVVVFFRVTARTAQLGAASAWLSGSPGSAAPAKPEAAAEDASAP